MNLANKWQDYEMLDMANGEKLERWQDIILVRPDPQVIWSEKGDRELWKNIHAHYHRSSTGGGYWEYFKKVPDSWVVTYKELKFNIKPMGFKHTGLFPEQAVNWDFMIDKIKGANRNIKVLNLFAYTGGATVACSYAGASVVHVDSSKGMNNWAKDNIRLSGLEKNEVRFIQDDVIKFVEREIRRGNKYDAIVMDPPSYGRGANGEIWDIEKDLYYLIKLCSQILSDKPLFFLVNSYTRGISPTLIANLLEVLVNNQYKGLISCGEVGIPVTNSALVLPCGIYGRWEENA